MNPEDELSSARTQVQIPETMEIRVAEEDPMTFLEAVHSLNLPRPSLVGGKKKRVGAAPRKKGKGGGRYKEYAHIKVVELSGFAGKGVTRSALKELINGISLLPNISVLKLTKNDLSDDYIEEIESIFELTHIKSIDLSGNLFKRIGDVIGPRLKDEWIHIQYLDFSLNYLPNEGNIALYYGLQKQDNLMYFGLSVKESLSENIIKHLEPRKPIAINFAGSKLSENAVTHLARALRPSKIHQHFIVSLSLKQTFLTSKQVKHLSDALRVNNTLTSLDVSHNYISDIDARILVSALADNQTLKELNLSHNLLDISASKSISKILESNETIQEIDISHNPIKEVSGQLLLEAVLMHNETLKSFGPIESNLMMGVRRRQEIQQCLTLNDQSKEVKRANVEKIGFEGSKRTFRKEPDYPLLKPIAFTNTGEEEGKLLWNLA